MAVGIGKHNSSDTGQSRKFAREIEENPTEKPSQTANAETAYMCIPKKLRNARCATCLTDEFVLFRLTDALKALPWIQDYALIQGRLKLKKNTCKDGGKKTEARS